MRTKAMIHRFIFLSSFFFLALPNMSGAATATPSSTGSCPNRAIIAGATKERCLQNCTTLGYSSAFWDNRGLDGDASAKCCCTGVKDTTRTGGKTGAVSFSNIDANPLKTLDVPLLAGDIIRAILGILGIIALIIFIYGGMLWMTALGDETKVKRGLNTMVWAGAGMIVIFGSYALVQFILSKLLGG